jgi:class 3 adenylate cyclase
VKGPGVSRGQAARAHRHAPASPGTGTGAPDKQVIGGGPSARLVGRSCRRVRNVAVLFADIEGCTRLCEELPPPEMNRVLERYFSRFLDMVRGSGGEITEIHGDGVLGLFEGASPQKSARRAVTAALGIQRAAAALNARDGPRHAAIVVHIGIHAGRALVGVRHLRGRTSERWIYCATGPVTNVAARLCERATHGRILVSGELVRALHGAHPMRRLGWRRLRNVSAPVEVFEVVVGVAL